MDAHSAEPGALALLHGLQHSPAAPPLGSVNPIIGNPCSAAGYAARTMNHQLTVLSAFYAFAIDAELGPMVNPVPHRIGRDANPHAIMAVHSHVRGAGPSSSWGTRNAPYAFLRAAHISGFLLYPPCGGGTVFGRPRPSGIKGEAS